MNLEQIIATEAIHAPEHLLTEELKRRRPFSVVWMMRFFTSVMKSNG